MSSISLIFVVIVSDVMMYVTLPLHVRLLYVLMRSKKVQLDGSFHTLMVHTTIANLIFSLDVCFIQAPAAAGVLYEFYKAIGPFVAKVEMIKSTTVILLGGAFHLVLAFSRFTAISRPTKHSFIWRKLSRICFVLWLITLALSVPLLLPGSTDFVDTTNVFGVRSIQFTFRGNYFAIYSISFNSVGAVMEFVTILCYIGMLAKFREFRNRRNSESPDIRRMTIGVVRTTVAAICAPIGAWTIVLFFTVGSLYELIYGHPLFRPIEFSSVFGLLNSINNVLTPWVLLVAFPKVRKSIVQSSCKMKICCQIKKKKLSTPIVPFH